jgi:hypothetical protein
VDGSLASESDERALLAPILDAVAPVLEQGTARVIAEVRDDIRSQIRRDDDCTSARLIEFLEQARYGTRTGFDKRHRRVSRKVERFELLSWVAEQLEDWERDRLEGEILAHLQDALDA